jgi:hypothetical protein
MTDDLTFQVLPAPGAVTYVRGGAIVACGEAYVGIAWPVALAERICELLNEHGALEPINTIDQQGDPHDPDRPR